MGVPRTPFLAVIAIPAILSTALFNYYFMRFGLNNLYFDSIINYTYRNTPGRSSWMTALPCIGSGRLLRVSVGLCGGWAVGAQRRRRKEAKDEEKNEK